MAMEDLDREVGDLSGNLENSIADQNPKDLKMKIHNAKLEDVDGLQMLRLPQEEGKSLLNKDMILPSESDFESLNKQPLLKKQVDDHLNYFQVSEPVIQQKVCSFEKPQIKIVNDEVEHDVPIRRIALKSKDIEAPVVKPALVKKEMSEIHEKLSEQQQKIFQDFHVKFVLEGVNVEEDDESRARKHLEFVELKKRLEEEEKMYAGCALGEASDIIDASDIKNPIEYGQKIRDCDYNGGKDINSSANFVGRNVLAKLQIADEDVVDSLSEEDAMDGVINSLTKVAICRRGDSSPKEDVKSQLQLQNVNNAMKGMASDGEGLSELQQYTNREGSMGCQCCCRKAGKQIDDIDESDVYMPHSSYSVLNVVCPVSGIPVVDLEDPIRSEECEHIYDHSSALNFIASMAKDGFCSCASLGCCALLAENKLITDNQLWQDIEELRQIKAAMWEKRMLQDLVNSDDSDDD